MTDPNDLIQSIARGNQDAFRQLYDLLGDKVYNTALSYVQNAEDAEEITQDVFIKIHQNAGNFKGESAVSTWVYRITVNTALNVVKRKKRWRILPFGTEANDQPDFEHPGVLLEKKEHAKYLFKAIDRLPESQKTAFILSYVEGLPRQEVADIMEVSLKAVESLLQRGKKNLRDHLEKMYPHRRNSKK
ncbi:MAG: RNA polymerase sigma factor [Bacteroidetes bacterium]|nr:MAG: RNA polymerase sigma factor [Bacteroidota bacterium]